MYKALTARNHFLFTILSILFFANCNMTVQSSEVHTDENKEYSYQEVEQKEFGFDIRDYHFESFKIKPNMFMANVLMGYGVAYDKILDLEKKAEKVFSMRKIHAGKDIVFVRKDICEGPICFAYSPDSYSYVLYEFGDEVDVKKIDRPYEICQKTISGAIFSGESISHDLLARGGSLDLIDKLEDALAQVYFGGAQPGDKYKIIYEEILIEGKVVGVGNIYAAEYNYASNPANSAYGFYYTNDRYQGYYDVDGKANKRSFLRSPIREKYRISSRFNRNRLHPVLKYRRPHLGTDFAAATGTPIMAVADGVITQRSYTKGNGNYVKMKHDKIYESQYLHMSKFRGDVAVGTRVKQGDIIGYVGSTGLATGPHVCFRFWKNGKQINHMAENFAPLEPMPAEELPSFLEERDVLLNYLTDIPYVDYQKEQLQRAPALAAEEVALPEA